MSSTARALVAAQLRELRENLADGQQRYAELEQALGNLQRQLDVLHGGIVALEQLAGNLPIDNDANNTQEQHDNAHPT